MQPRRPHSGHHRPQQISRQEQRQDDEPYCRDSQHRPDAGRRLDCLAQLIKGFTKLVNPRLAENRRSAGLFHGMKLFFLYLALLAAACAVLLLADDPSRSGWLPECLFYKTTGYLCYGCGSTRALHALLHGHWLDSLRYNVLLVPTLIWLGTLFFIRDKTVFLRVLTAGVAVLALFTVARNIPLS
ncbi:hypothetical protein CXU19_07875 [Akkermansia muciniphila]|nr:hypothetical protein CXU19_07875 [Akkermansia muciniphila]PNC39348.1 hypothetical protein CXU20_07775 [Akkermansia muciniphila]